MGAFDLEGSRARSRHRRVAAASAVEVLRSISLATSLGTMKLPCSVHSLKGWARQSGMQHNWGTDEQYSGEHQPSARLRLVWRTRPRHAEVAATQARCGALLAAQREPGDGVALNPRHSSDT